jgi:hypothetical protein
VPLLLPPAPPSTAAGPGRRAGAVPLVPRPAARPPAAPGLCVCASVCVCECVCVCVCACAAGMVAASDDARGARLL